MRNLCEEAAGDGLVCSEQYVVFVSRLAVYSLGKLNRSGSGGQSAQCASNSVPGSSPTNDSVYV